MLLLASCSDNRAMRLRYEAERLYYQADKQMKTAVEAPESSRNALLKAAADYYGETLEFALTALDSISAELNPVELREVRYLAFQSANRLSSLYFQARSFDTCVTILTRLLSKASFEGAAQVTTDISLGRALQASGKWDSALTVYHRALDSYYPPVDDSGEVVQTLFKLPLHIFQISQAVGDSAASREHYDYARQYYSSLIDKDSAAPLTRQAHAALASLYQSVGKYGKVVTELGYLADSTADNYIDLRINIAETYSRMPDGNDSALAVYDDLLDHLKASDSLYRPRLIFKKILLKMESGEYRYARDMLIDLKKNYPYFYENAPAAQFTLARAFELLGRWNRAETEYKYLIEKFRGSQQAMATFLYLGDQLLAQGRDEEGRKWYQDAEAYYDEIAARGAGTLMEARALTFKADLYKRLGNYRRSAELLVAVFNKFPSSEMGRKGLLQAASIYRKQLNQPQMADSLVGRLRAMLLEPEEGWGT